MIRLPLIRFATFCAVAFVILAMSLIHGVAAAQGTYPNRPVRVIVPFGAGGVADITVRLVTEKMGDALGQKFIIENVPSAGGTVAAQRALVAPPDGYTLALFSNGTAISVPLFQTLGFNPETEFTPIATMAQFDFVLATHAAATYRSMADFLAAAKQKPGALNVATINIGSSQHLSALLLESVTDTKFAVVPFRNTPDALQALLRGEVDLMVDTYAAMRGPITDGRLRALAVSGPARSAFLPQIPVMAELGHKSYDVTSWNALFARSGTPADIVERLNQATSAALKDPALVARLAELGLEPAPSTPEALGDRLRRDIARWSAVIDAAKVPRQ